MKKKSPRGIPDFSSKRPGFKQGPSDVNKDIKAPPPNQPKIKPQHTSVKGGQRGQ
jgi:hypothetical protein